MGVAETPLPTPDVADDNVGLDFDHLSATQCVHAIGTFPQNSCMDC